MAQDITTVKINELATSSINASDYFVKADTNGIAYKNTLSALASFIGSVGVSGYQGALAIADTPTEDGFYFASESGTYTNAGGLVVDLANGINIISVEEGQTVFELVVIPVDLSSQLVQEITEGDTTNAPSSDAVTKYVKSSRVNPIFQNPNPDPLTDSVIELVLFNVPDGTKLYLRNLQNFFGGATYYTGVRIVNEAGDYVCSFFKANSADIRKYGISYVQLEEENSSGISGFAKINWDIILDTGNNNFELTHPLTTNYKPVNRYRQYQGVNTVKPIPALLSVKANKLEHSNYYVTVVRNDDVMRQIYISKPGGTADDVLSSYAAFQSVPYEGVEEILMSPRAPNHSGYYFKAVIDWSKHLDYIFAYNYVDLEILPELDESLGQIVSPMVRDEGTSNSVVRITSLKLKFENQKNILDSYGNVRKLFISRIENTEVPSNPGLYRSAVYIENEESDIVAWFFQQGSNQDAYIMSGIKQVPLNEFQDSGSGISGVIELNWDLLKGKQLIDIDLEINRSVIEEALQDAHNVSPIQPEQYSFAKNYPDAIEKAPNYANKMRAHDEDVNIVFLGNSLTAITSSNSDLADSVAQVSPPRVIAKNWQHYFWRLFYKNFPVWQRYDLGIFTESGAWSTGVSQWQSPSVPAWSFNGNGAQNNSRFTQTSGAYVEFNWDLSNLQKLNFVHDLDYRSTNSVTVTVSGGNGQVEVYNGTAWVEANNYNFSQQIPQATEGSGNALYVSKVRLEFRRVATSGVNTIRFTKGADTDYFFYWGIERWSEIAPIITNAGRGGHTFEMLGNSIKDLEYYKPDLIVLELPLINEINQTSLGQDIINHAQDFIWGDRAGNLNPNNLVDLYPDSDIIIIIPHIDVENWSGNNPVVGVAGSLSDMDGYRVAQKLKKLISDKGDIGYIDMMEEMIDIGKKNGWSIEQTFNRSLNGGIPISMLKDGSHCNDYGAEIWASVLNANLKY